MIVNEEHQDQGGGREGYSLQTKVEIARKFNYHKLYLIQLLCEVVILGVHSYTSNCLFVES